VFGARGGQKHKRRAEKKLTEKLLADRVFSCLLCSLLIYNFWTADRFFSFKMLMLPPPLVLRRPGRQRRPAAFI